MITAQVIILGGGPAGLACAFYAQKKNKKFIIIEKNKILGGNALTFKNGPYLYDSGAHRWHNVYPEITQDILGILPESFKKISVPSSISYKNRKIQFPLSPLDLLLKLSMKDLFAMAWSYLRRHSITHPEGSFAHNIQKKYGHKVSDAFLWHYSEKLWGESPRNLSNEVSGKRLKGLDVKTFFKKEPEHLDGSFYYPDRGIGEIFGTIASGLPQNSCLVDSMLEEIEISNNQIVSVKMNNTRIDTSDSLIINTLAPSVFTKLMTKEMKSPIDGMKFRSLILIFLEIKKSSFSPFASIYFPDKHSPITRVVEPRNRSGSMAPVGMTSLVLEWPCTAGEGIWNDSGPEIVAKAIKWAEEHLSLKPEECISGEVQKLPMAYPVLKKDSLIQRDLYLKESKVIKNLHHIGRNACFSYLHLHDIFLEAKELFSANGKS